MSLFWYKVDLILSFKNDYRVLLTSDILTEDSEDIIQLRNFDQSNVFGFLLSMHL